MITYFDVEHRRLIGEIRFLDSWKMGDYSAAFDSLHQYFDYTMHSRDRTFYQYALLNLAVLHADFGAHLEAIAAIQETISTAREHNDLACLNYSLSWLYHFGKAYPKYLGKVHEKGFLGADKEVLAFLKAKAKESSMWSTLSASLLSEAKLAMSNVRKSICGQTGGESVHDLLTGRLGRRCIPGARMRPESVSSDNNKERDDRRGVSDGHRSHHIRQAWYSETQEFSSEGWLTMV